jgi:hypothetical protein
VIWLGSTARAERRHARHRLCRDFVLGEQTAALTSRAFSWRLASLPPCATMPYPGVRACHFLSLIDLVKWLTEPCRREVSPSSPV